jgi:hypothetical protein
MRLLPLILALLTVSVRSASYFIDYDSGSDAAAGMSTNAPWKKCPGMPGFSGTYSHTVGDTFIFKGGVTWPSNSLPITVAYSGTSTNAMDSYGGYNQSWFAGSSWTNPVFAGNVGIDLTGKNFIRIGFVRFYGSEMSYASDSIKYSVYAYNAPVWTVHNCIFDSDLPFGITAPFSVDCGPILILSNTFNLVGNALDINIDPGLFCSGLDIGWNVMSSITTNFWFYHPDGFQFTQGAAGQPYRDVRFHHNRFFGDWKDGATAHVWAAGWTNGLIYNNLFSVDQTNLSGGLLFNGAVYGGGNRDLRIFNNTFSSDSLATNTEGFQYFIYLTSGNTNITITNNIFSHGRNDIGIFDAFAGVTMDYNIHHAIRGSFIYTDAGTVWDWATFTNLGYEAHGFTSDPLFIIAPNGVTGHGDWHVATNSPTIGAGINLRAVFADDLDANLRASSPTNWTIGAYEIASTNTPPDEPEPPAANGSFSVDILRVNQIIRR